MATFVLVHGAWHGAWCWRRVTRLLTAHGHEVFAPTLTGVGERAHLLTPTIDLRTHIADVVNLMKWERLDGVVLVGHSYGGMVASGVAEEVGGAIGSIVFLDAFYPESGQSPPIRRSRLPATDRGSRAQGRCRVAAASRGGVPRQRRTAPGRCAVQPHPIRCFTQKLTHSVRASDRKQDLHPAAGYPNEGFDAAAPRRRPTAGGFMMYPAATT